MKSMFWKVACICALTLGLISCGSDGKTEVERPMDEDGLFVMDFQPAGQLPTAVKYPAVYVQFSKPVVPVAKLGQPSDKSDLMKIEPPLEGVFRWYGTSLLSFDASEAIIPQREYTVTLSDSIVSVDGSPISGQRIFTFRTEPLKLESITPGYKAALDGFWVDNNDLPVEDARSLALYFSYPVETREIAKYLEIVDGNGKSYQFDISQPDKKNLNLVELFLKETPPDNTTMTVVLKAGARSDSDSIGTVEEDRSHSYHTLRPFQLQSVYQGSSSRGTEAHPVILQFSHRLDEEQDKATIAAAITARKQLPADAGKQDGEELALAVTAENIGISGNQLRIHGLDVTFEESYTLEVAANVIKDVYGRLYDQTIGPESITVPAAASFVQFKDYGFVMLEAAFPPQLAFAYQNLLPKSSYAVAALSGGQWKQVEKVEFDASSIPKNQQIVEAVDLRPALKDGFGAARFTADMQYQWTNWQGQKEISSRKNVQVVQVTDLGLTVRYGFNRAVVLVSQLSTGKPVEGATVSLYAMEKYLDEQGILPGLGKADVSGTTDRNGFAVLHLDNDLIGSQIQQVFISAEKGQDKAVFAPSSNALWGYGSVRNPQSAQTTQMVTFMFTDRGLYKPGERVTVRGIDRNLTLGEYDAYVGKATLTLWQSRWQAEPIETRTLDVSQSGGFWASFDLGEDLTPGAYVLSYERTLPDGNAVSSDVSFTVAFFERLRFESSVDIPAMTYLSGDRLSASLSASYLGGGSLAGSTWRGDWYREPTYFAAEGKDYEDYRFGPIEGYDGRTALTEERGQLDASGEASTAQFSGGEKVAGKPYLYRVETTVTDSGGQAISANTSAVVHPASFYIGLSQPKDVKGFPKKEVPLTFDFALVTPESRLAADSLLPGSAEQRLIQVELLREDWKQVRQMGASGRLITRYFKEMVEEYSGTERLTQTGSITVTPPRGGAYLLRLSTQDSRGRKVITERSFYVSGSDWSYYYSEGSQQINMIPDKDLYQVEETAQIMVQSPLPAGEYLMTIEREGIFSQEVISLKEPTTVLEVPITDRYLPVVYVTLSSYSVRTGEPEHDFTSVDLDKPKGYFGATALHVSPKAREFNVEIQMDKALYRPGEEATVTLKATSQDGQPLAGAELTLLAVDRGVIDLINYHVPDPLEFFYRESRFFSAVYGGDSHSLLIDPVTYEVRNLFGGDESMEKGMEESTMDRMMAMNAAAGGAEQVRSNFDPTAVFAPVLVTGADGTVTHSFTLPDSLTEYRVTAVGVLGTSHFGLEEGELSVNNPVSVRDVLPRRLRENDVSDIGVVVSNLDGQSHEVTVSMELVSGLEAAGLPAEAGGIRRLEGEARLVGAATKTISVPAGKTLPILFDMQAQRQGFVSVVFTVDSAVVKEKIVKPLEIDRPYIYETVTTVGEVSSGDVERREEASVREAIILPAGLSGEHSGGLQVVLDPTRLGTLTEAITYVFRYPYGCLEQRASAMLPLVYFGDYIDVFGLESEVENPSKVVETEIADWATLQKSDGGFPYWRSSTYSSLPATLRIAELLAAARQHDIRLPDGINLDTLVSFIKKEAASEWYRDSGYVQAYSLFVLSKLGETVAESDIDRVVAMENLGFSEKAMCGILYLGRGTESKARQIEADVRRHARPTVRGVDITQSGRSAGWMYFNDESEMNALLLQFFTELDYANDMNQRLLFNLLEIQRAGNGYWKNTASTARVLEAIACYIEANNLENLNLEGQLSLGGKTLAEGEFRGAGAKPVERNLTFDQLAEMGLESGSELPLEVSKDGRGNLFYTLSMRYALPTEEQTARDEGLSLYVELVDTETDQVVTDNRLKAGTIYKATVTLSTTKNRTFVAMRVPIPSGAEVLNAEFATMPQLAGTATSGDEAVEPERDAWGNYQFGPGHNFGLSSREIYDNEVRYFWDAFRRGRQQVEFLFRPVRSGSFTVPSATAECMYEPEIFGRTQGAVVVISE